MGADKKAATNEIKKRMKLTGVGTLLLSTVNANDDTDKYARGNSERITQIATFDIAVNGEQLGQVEIGLFGGVVPRTVKNFASLCEGWSHPETGKRYSYAGSKIHRISYDFVIQGGMEVARMVEDEETKAELEEEKEEE